MSKTVLCTFSSDSASQLNIFWHNGDPLGMNGTQVGVFEKSHQISFAGFLESHDCRTLETKISFEVLGYLTDQSLEATVPGLYLCGFFTPPVAGALLRAALVANCFLGAFPPVDLRAVCLVRAIFQSNTMNSEMNDFSISELVFLWYTLVLKTRSSLDFPSRNTTVDWSKIRRRDWSPVGNF